MYVINLTLPSEYIAEVVELVVTLDGFVVFQNLPHLHLV
jgi:hypothetical protein